MSDRELLEMAAKAAGIVGHFENNGDKAGLFLHDEQNPSVWRRWNPLDKDDDALRLAVKLGIVFQYLSISDIDKTVAECNGAVCGENHGFDPCEATRRAIVRCAAEVGRAELTYKPTLAQDN